MAIFSNLTSNFNQFFIKIISALAILLLGLVIGRFLAHLIQKILHGLELNKILEKEFKITFPLEQFIGSIMKYIAYLIALILSLNQLGLTTTVLTIMLIFVFILILIFIILAIKDFIPNIMSGLLINQKKLLKKGDIITVKNIKGEVIEVTLTETKIKTKDKEIIFIPNSIITRNELYKKLK